MIEKKAVVEFVKKHPNATFLDIAKGLKIDFKENRELTNTIFELVKDMMLVQNGKNVSKYVAIEKEKEVEGRIRFASEGRFAFVEEEDNKSLPKDQRVSYFVPSVYFNKAMNNDFVLISVYRYVDPEQNKNFAIVDKIISRATNKIVGFLEMSEKVYGFRALRKDYKKMNFKVLDVVKEARLNDLVAAEIVEFKKNVVEVKIVKKLANISDPMAYVKAMTYEKNIPDQFPDDVNAYCNILPDQVKEEEKQNRIDLTQEMIVTIDGQDTKDFDDAIQVKKNSDGTFELGVHIADVSYYVQEYSPIDKEALKRGTSYYLVDGVVPMLPTKLSNGICSLNPDVERLTISAIMHINSKGQTLKTELKPTVIKSQYRLTYDRVNEFINSRKIFENPELNNMLDDAAELATILRKYKKEQGYIDFEIEEPSVVLDDNGETLDIVVEKSGFSENMIEDFMVRANEEVASYLTQRKIPLLYRVHEKPDDEKIDYLLEVLNALNINVDIDRSKLSPKSFQKIVQKIKETRDDNFLKMLFLRTMQKAVYSPTNEGHFGLASKDYCHFTSPIRRYPDLIVHRIIRNIVFLNKKEKIEHYKEVLPKFGTLSSENEQKALQAERDTNDLKFAEYWKPRIGKTYMAQIISILKFGMFVQFQNRTEALIHISTMNDEDYEPNENFTELKSRRNKFKLGEVVGVVIVGASASTGKVDAVLSHNYESYLYELKNKTYNKTDKYGKDKKKKK